jgi:hypothetical protein
VLADAPGFTVEARRCWQTVYDHNLQATHCDDAPPWTGLWRSPKGDHRWVVWACTWELDGLTGLREFGQRRG